MNFGMRDIYSALAGASLSFFLIVACGAIPGDLHDRILDVDKGMLTGAKPEFDKPLSWCKDVTCYVYEDRDVRRIKKHIAEIEVSLAELQKKCKK